MKDITHRYLTPTNNTSNMAPKKKGGKKQNEDWENDLGETPDPIAQATEDANGVDGDGAADGEAPPVSGLMAALRKNKAKRAKKGKLDNDFVEGEDPSALDSPAPETVDLNGKAPEEANIEDEDVFANTGKKGKGGKKQADKPAAVDADEDEDGGGMKSKKEKEKEKREREKARKKEQVGHLSEALNCH